jgi:hypothetical protein
MYLAWGLVVVRNENLTGEVHLNPHEETNTNKMKDEYRKASNAAIPTMTMSTQARSIFF